MRYSKPRRDSVPMDGTQGKHRHSYSGLQTRKNAAMGDAGAIAPASLRLSPINGDATQFVWFYVLGPNNGEELALSIRSIQKNFAGTAEITVIGDKPAWYGGHYIPLQKFSGIKDHKNRMAYRDTQHKLVTCVADSEIDEEFVWMMDDCFMLKPTTIEDMRIQRYDPWYKVSMKSTWHKLIGDTFGVLRKNGKPTLQYGTHLPHVFTKTNLLDMFQRYQYPRNLYLFEILYGNNYRNQDEALPYSGIFNEIEYPSFLVRHLTPQKLDQLELTDSNFLNYQSPCWNQTMKTWVEQRLSEEIGEPNDQKSKVWRRRDNSVRH